jgi:hypothetical protein
MRYISTLLILLATASCSTNQKAEQADKKDTVFIPYSSGMDTLVIDTLKKKVNAKNRYSPKCESYPKWKQSLNG